MSADAPSKRSIRSFVRRGGRLTPSQRNALQHYWPSYGIEYNWDIGTLSETTLEALPCHHHFLE